MISIKQVAKFVVGLGDRVSPTDVEEGMRVGLVLSKLPPSIPNVAGLTEQITRFLFLCRQRSIHRSR